ncbi:hypothetical protein [Pseudoclavibacter helvolus]|uniref:Uncharacterized protein n=1 Tax=Pseudoclavibacter helvolus TaxID=255205 RepID=A0A7W4YHZ4_9MICO|nr:hypothetical protein [Pseudoclavibacter helvolus]MBB2959510.1 hypothetical protein [Pseudoclavibacter helvolus]
MKLFALIRDRLREHNEKELVKVRVCNALQWDDSRCQNEYSYATNPRGVGPYCSGECAETSSLTQPF